MDNGHFYSRFSCGRVVRIFVLTIVATVCIGAFSGFVSVVKASNGLLNPPHWDYGEDTDIPPNGLYNNLVVTVNVSVNVSGTFQVHGWLYDNSGMNLITTGDAMAALGLGNQTILLRFPGHMIRTSGYDGPYQFDMVLLDEMWNLLDMGSNSTNAYLHTDFDFTPAYLDPPHNDYGRDTNGDPLYEYLVVETSLTVNSSGDYEVDAVLLDSTGMFFIDMLFNTTYLNAGPQIVELAFNGYVIRSSGFNGPYIVQLYLYDEFFNFLGNDTHFTGMYLWSDFQYPSAYFFPPHTESISDTDGDTLIDYLNLTVMVNVSVGGLYRMQATSIFGGTTNETYLSPGIQPVGLAFWGYEIFQAGVDGPYTIDLWLFDEDFNFLDNDTYITAPYLFANFESVSPILFSPPHWDYGIDTDGDTDYNYVVVGANVTVNTPGFFEIDGDMYDNSGSNFITSTTNATWLDEGSSTVDLLFDGSDINRSGYDGPYMVNLNARDPSWVWFDGDTHYTQPYLASDFDVPPAYFHPPHSDFGLDTSLPPDMVYEFLAVNASVFVNDPGWYMLQGVLFDPAFAPITSDMKVANLTAGFSNVTLTFSGVEINRRGLSGMFFVQMALFQIVPGGSIYLDDDSHATGLYAYDSFVSLPVTNIWGYVYNASSGAPVEKANVWATNYTYGWIGQVTTNSSGYYELGAFDGDFFVNIDRDDLQGDTSFVSVVGSTEVTRSLDLPPPSEVSTSLTFSDWDNIYGETTMLMQHDNQSTRFMVDVMVGNLDGYVNKTESDLFISIMVGAGAPMMNDTRDALYVDGIHYDLVPGTYMINFSIEGSVISQQPPFALVTHNFTSNTTIPVSNTHRIEINNTYDTPEEVNDMSGALPAGFTLWGYDPVADVTFSGVGTPNFYIDPLMDPNPADAIDWIWVNLTAGLGLPDNTEPQVLSVTINGLVAPVYYLSNLPSVFYLNATIDDSGTGGTSIGGANYTEGWQNWPSSAPMNPVDGSFDSPTEDVTVILASPPPMGMTQYCVYGWDLVPNFNVIGVCASVTIFDDLAPQIRNVMIDGAPTQTYALSTVPISATLTATIDDSTTGGWTIGGANSTDYLGVTNFMVAQDGTFDEVTEDVTAPMPVPDYAGVFDYYISSAWDTNPNYNTSSPSAQITIIDDIEPRVLMVRLNSQPTITVPPGTQVFVQAIVNDMSGRGNTTIQGANYTVGAQNWASSTPMSATDGVFDDPFEGVTTAPGFLDTTAWPDGPYQICVYGWDSTPNYNTTGTCAVLMISAADNQPPRVYNVLLNDLVSTSVTQGDQVYLNATIDDGPTGNSPISNANYTVDFAWPGTDMNPMDGTFDSPMEGATIIIDTSSLPVGVHDICVHASDDVPNDNTTFNACAQLTIQPPPDSQSPTITNERAEPPIQEPGDILKMLATVNDNVQVDGVWVEITDPSSGVSNYSMSFDAGNDEYYYTGSFNDIGTYTFTIWANDTSNNWASATETFRIQETNPPTIVVTIDNEEPRVGDTVRFEAEVDDPSGVDRVRIEITKDGDTILSNRTMQYDSGDQVYYYEVTFDEAGDYDYFIRASDEYDNWGEETDALTVEEEESPAGPSFLEEYWWILLLVIIIIVVVVLLIFFLRRPKAQVYQPLPEEPVAPEPPPMEPEGPPEAPLEEPPPPPEDEDLGLEELELE